MSESLIVREFDIQTASGRMINLVDIEPERLAIEDIAHALSQICRFTGHTQTFYSVAEHCVLGSRMVPDDLKLLFLLHDAAEAYLGDVASPHKRLNPAFKDLEATFSDAIYRKFAGRTPDGAACKAIKKVDLQLLKKEAMVLLPRGPAFYTADTGTPVADIDVSQVPILPLWAPDTAMHQYLTAFRLYTGAAGDV